MSDFISQANIDNLNKNRILNKKEVENTVKLIETDKNEYDLFYIDKLIRQDIKSKQEKIPNINKQIKKLNWIKNNSTNFLEVEEAKEKIWKFEKFKNKYENDNQIEEYNSLVKNIIISYNNLLSQHIESSFLRNEDNEQLKQLKRKKQLILIHFLQIASKYIKIKPFRNNQITSFYCTECNGESFEITEDHNMCCVNCNTCFDQLEQNIGYKDKDRINMTKRFKYSCHRHFDEAMQNFQGNKRVKLPPNLMEKIMLFIERNPNITNENITLRHTRDILKKYGFKKNYEDLYYIHHLITKKPKNDISKYEEVLKRDYAIQHNVKIKSKRKSSLNVYFILCMLLQKNNYDCKLEDFYCLQTDDTKEEHYKIWKQKCKILGWDYIEK